MFELSEGFIALPGGFGTLEEVAEVITWQQLGLHRFPIGFLNTNGFYDPLFEFFDSMVRSALLKEENRSSIVSDPTIGDLLSKMKTNKVSHVTKWIDKSEVC